MPYSSSVGVSSSTVSAIGESVRHVEERADRTAHAVDQCHGSVVEGDACLQRGYGHPDPRFLILSIVESPWKIPEDPFHGGKRKGV